jgi:hypothetical protein
VLVERIRYQFKLSLLRSARPLRGNRVRAHTTVALDISEREFLVLFGGLAGLATSVGRTGARV